MEHTTNPYIRRRHLIDIENLMRTPDPTKDEALECCELYQRYIRPGDQIVMACCHLTYPSVAWYWPEARRLVRSGPDGADRALIEALRTDPAIYQEVVIASGDGIFAEEVRRLRGKGIYVTVISNPKSLSRELARVANRIEYFPDLVIPSEMQGSHPALSL